MTSIINKNFLFLLNCAPFYSKVGFVDIDNLFQLGGYTYE